MNYSSLAVFMPVYVEGNVQGNRIADSRTLSFGMFSVKGRTVKRRPERVDPTRWWRSINLGPLNNLQSSDHKVLICMSDAAMIALQLSAH